MSIMCCSDLDFLSFNTLSNLYMYFLTVLCCFKRLQVNFHKMEMSHLRHFVHSWSQSFHSGFLAIKQKQKPTTHEEVHSRRMAVYAMPQTRAARPLLLLVLVLLLAVVATPANAQSNSRCSSFNLMGNVCDVQSICTRCTGTSVRPCTTLSLALLPITAYASLPCTRD